MTTLREAAQRALEALEYRDGDGADQWKADVITALRAALAGDALDRMADNARELGLNYDTAPPQRNPLTDDQLDDIVVAARRGNLYDLRIAIERANGIGGQE